METLLNMATKEVRGLQGVCSLIFQMNDGFHIFLSPLSVRWWWWTAAVEPAGWCCSPCSGLCRVVCSPGVTSSLKGLPPLLPLWTWPEPFLWNVRSWCLALYEKKTIKTCWNLLRNKWICVWISSTHKNNKLFNSIDVDQFLGSIKATLGSLLERYTGAEITDKLGSSILATLFRQQVQHSYCDLNGFVFSLVFFLCDYSFDCNISCGPGRSFYFWSCAFWTSLTVHCWRASLLWWSCSEVYPLILETSFRRSVKSQNSPPLGENAYNIASYRTMYQLKRACVSKSFVFWRISGFPVKCDQAAMTALPMILHYGYLFQLKDPPLSISHCKCLIRWTRRPGISPSSQWCWGPGMWNPLTTTRTAVMRPPSMPAPVLHHLKWSLMSAVRRRRGGIK